MTLEPMVAALSWNQTWIILAILLAAVLAAGVLVYRGRKGVGTGDPAPSLVRSWIAVALVIGLLVFGVLSFLVEDLTVRSTLIGGLTASAGAAIAFYFSSKASEGARRDIIDAAMGTEQVPDLAGKTASQAEATLARTSLKLETDPTGSKDPAAIVAKGGQTPDAGTTARRGSTVTIKLTAQPNPAPPAATP